jgi:hypothetical protein
VRLVHCHAEPRSFQPEVYDKQAGCDRAGSPGMKKAAPKSSLWFQTGVKKNLVYCMTIYALDNQLHRPFFVGTAGYVIRHALADSGHRN